MDTQEIRREILSFAGPIMLEQTLMSLISIVTMAMVGHLGAVALSAVGLTNQPVYIAIAVLGAINVGATALVSRMTGAGDEAGVRRAVAATLALSLWVGVGVSLLSLIFSRNLVLMMGAKADTVAAATLYMRYMSAGVLFQSVPTAVASVLRGRGDSKSPLRYNLTANGVNLLTGALLIYGLGAGLHGAGIASVLAKATATVLSLVALWQGPRRVRVPVSHIFRWDGDTIRRIVNVGFSAAIESFIMRFGFLMYTRIIADLGTTSMAAHQICLSVTGFVSGAINGFGMAASAFTGRFLGSGEPERAERYCLEMRRIGMAISLTVGASYYFIGPALAGMFTRDAEVVAMAALTLKVAAFITPPQNSLVILIGSLRGAGDTRWPMVNAIIGTVVVRLILATLLVRFAGLGLPGAWAAAFADQFARSVMVFFRFRKGQWKTRTV